jgi:acyl carrier protein
MGAIGDALDQDQAFTSLGLDSLTAVELRNRLQAILGKPVPATAAFEWPTIANMAEGLNELFGAAADAGGDDSVREEITL